MADTCPVCDAVLGDGDQRCPRCGFPRALYRRLNGPVALPAEPEPPERPVARSRRFIEPDDPEAEVNAALARTLEERTELLHTIDHDAPDVTGELCEAALNEASGRASDAQQILRSAQGRLDRETEELLSRHLESLEQRGRLLETTGLRLALEEELARLAETIVAGAPSSSVAALVTAERRMDALEAHWRGLQGLFAQVAALRNEAEALGIDLSGVPDRIAAVRAGLAAMPATDHELDLAAQVAAETLMHLHEAIPPALERELAEHGLALEQHPGRPTKVAAAREQHREAVDHLRSGRLEDAVRSVRELRTTIRELARQASEPPGPTGRAPPPTSEPEAAVGAPATAEAPPPGAARPGPPAPVAAAGPAVAGAPAAPTADPETVRSLMMKARSLAMRIRSLPPDTDEATTAASQIHEATELLKAGRYAEADAALSRLMRVLIDSGSRS